MTSVVFFLLFFCIFENDQNCDTTLLSWLVKWCMPVYLMVLGFGAENGSVCDT